MTSRTRYTVNRDVTPAECWWLGETVTEGTTVYPYTGPTYGVVREAAVTSDPAGGTPFFELPYDALTQETP